ncbi:hypothetical protein HBH98_213670 [Parastagonospora nodorum]|nr:hypothetical protein HBH98_213670 [Parastagonospora nodorum]KAH4361042.1 hypothetical protein HBH97_202120 [Parastagonospora nodorum]KAH4376998.1 hypothetical protein HBH99_209020 [Parastagonospora nodorum]KAH5545526.1 hypothetical protein HBI25_220580 [Parastagonospora nodorum]KAH5559470.1 hypothetical protein HBI26_204830 [Parastagonospora nodorum]
MFSRGISFGMKEPQQGILSIPHYDSERIWNFIENENERVMTQWAEYLESRKLGHGPQLFSTLEGARVWLTQQAPVKLVDGAWLSHVHKITTPFALWGITKYAWQIFSEELGDGDITKHHVHLYRQLLANFGCQLPTNDTAEFISPGRWEGMENEHAWEAAVGQLTISLFPNEFLPEILGFNMHYELITLDTLRAAYELKALGIDPSYFLIHVSIDNADSGHAAMATHTVIRYLEVVRSTEGETALNDAWKRIQTGYAMSHALGSHSTQKQGDMEAPISTLHITVDEGVTSRVIDIMRSKALVSHKCHLQSRARIGGRSLSEWLAPSIWQQPSPQKHLELLTELGNAKPWVIAGASNKSLLIKELQWKGRMFGAFTHSEVVTIREWIDSLGVGMDSSVYWKFTSRKPVMSRDAVMMLDNPAVHHPVVFSSRNNIDPSGLEASSDSESSRTISEIWTEPEAFTLSPDLQSSNLLPLWFAHIGLLENAITTPSQTALPLYASILRLLRAQAGFCIETEIVAGMDELNRSSCLSLVDIGLEILSHADTAGTSPPTCLNDIIMLAETKGIHGETIKLSKDMLYWALQPKKNLSWLLGLAVAFLPVKKAVTRAPELLSKDTRLVLDGIVEREKTCLMDCVNVLNDSDVSECARFIRGYRYGSSALRRCLPTPGHQK